MIYDFYVNPQAAVADLRGIAQRAGNMAPALAAVREILFEGFERNWSSRGALFGRSWAPLAPGTLARKSRQGQSSATLVASGALEGALTGGGRGRVGRVTPSTVRAGVSGRTLFYGRFAHAGAGGNRRGTQPPRPIVGIDPRTRVEAVTIAQHYLMEGARL